MDKSVNKKVVLKGQFEDVIELENHYYLVNKKDRICVLPYTISTEGLLDKIGVIEDYNYIEEEDVYTLLNDFISEDDETDLVSANRIIYEIIGRNVTAADKWMYLGTLYNNMSSDSAIKIYAVNITDVEISAQESVEEKTERKNFKILDSSKVLQTDDMLFLASYLRLFNYFYVNSLNTKEDE